MTENRPTLEAVVGPDVALLLVDTWKRPIVVGLLAGPAKWDEAPFTLSFSQTPLDRDIERWRVFSGLEGEEEEEEEEVEDGVREEEQTMQAESGMVLEASSVATDTWETGISLNKLRFNCFRLLPHLFYTVTKTYLKTSQSETCCWWLDTLNSLRAKCSPQLSVQITQRLLWLWSDTKGIWETI